jgi:hypothetical protein
MFLATLLFVGLWTRAVTAANYLFYQSLLGRCPYINNRGDLLLLTLLLWGLVLPLAEV